MLRKNPITPEMYTLDFKAGNGRKKVMMQTTLVHIWVKPGCGEEFLRASLANRAGTLREPGNVRFDVLQDDGDPCRFYLYEIFADAEAVRAHKETPHYLAWRDAVADMMAEPRRGQPLQLHGE